MTASATTVRVPDSFSGLGEQAGLVLDVADGHDRGGGDPATQVGRFRELASPGCPRSPAFRRAAGALGWVEVQVFELVHAGQAEQAVAADEPVVQEAERALAVHGDQPQRQLGHLDGERVDVRPVQAVLGDPAPGGQQHQIDLGVRADPVAVLVLLRGERVGSGPRPARPRRAGRRGSGRQRPGMRRTPSRCRRPAARAISEDGRSRQVVSSAVSSGPGR